MKSRRYGAERQKLSKIWMQVLLVNFQGLFKYLTKRVPNKLFKQVGIHKHEVVTNAGQPRTWFG